MPNAEILAPAGGPESVKAAVRCGADAVYLGQKAFSARSSAQNFDAEQLRQTVQYCHVRGVKVYQTLNTVVFDHEWQTLRDCVKTACACGVDALIVQDLGVLHAVRRWAPAMPIHASTQMAIHSVQGAKLLESLGVKRVVLARELTLSEIRQIQQNTSLALEVFVHGALCMCVSGQCYLSAMVGSRSGNRGMCAQPCRLPFRAKDSQGEYALSLKDLCAVESIGALVDAGVASLKIEGRMKRPEYVAAAVTACRQALAGQAPDLETLQQVFSRSGFTNGYLCSERQATAVQTTDAAAMFGYRKKEDVTAAAGVLGRLKTLYHNEMARVPLTLSLRVQPNTAAVLTAQDDRGNVVTVTGAIPQPAQNQPLTAQMLADRMDKWGNTPFYCNHLDLTVGEGLYLEASKLNAMRREACAQLEAVRGKIQEIPFTNCNIEIKNNNQEYKARRNPAFRAQVTAASQLSARLFEALSMVIVPLDEIERDRQRLCKLPQWEQKIIIGLPRVLFATEQTVAARLCALAQMGFRHALAHTIGQVELIQATGLCCHADFTMNVVNSHSLQLLSQLKVQSTTVSIELKARMVNRLQKPMPCGIMAYGALPLMLMRNCPIKPQLGCSRCRKQGKLVDRTGAQFPIACSGEYVQLLNTDVLYLADKLGDFEQADFFTLYFTDESAELCEAILARYQKGLSWDKPYTRGLYYRGVQ